MDHDKEPLFQIHEVYYNQNDIPTSYTKEPVKIFGHDINDINWQIDKIKNCLDKPILYYGDRFPEEYQIK